MTFIVKLFWFLSRNILSLKRWLFYFLLKPSLFRIIGFKTKIYGKISFGTVEGNISIGKACMLGKNLFFSAGKNCKIVIGDEVSLNSGCHIVALFGITIGDYTRIGEFCSIRDQNHSFENPDELIINQGFVGGPIVIGNDCWIGRGCLISAGVQLGRGCVVAANSVVTNSFEPFSVIAGAPAKFIRKRGDRHKL